MKLKIKCQKHKK